MDLKNKTVMVVGTGISGIGAVDLLNKVGADCILYDGNEKLDRQKVQEKLGDNKAEIIIGAFDEALLSRIDLLVISPGVPIDSPIVITFKNAGIPVWGEIELAYNYDKGKVIAITGTNGKTTSVHMLKSILENAGKKVLVGGNGGGGFSGYYDLILEASNDDYDILLVEVCDMTLDFCNYCFDFDMVGLTNIGNDHMDVHKTIANYKNTLVRFFEGKTVFTAFNQDFNADFKEVASKAIPFFEYDEKLQVWGRFNALNAGLVAAIATELKIPKDIIMESLADFKAVEGRMNVYKINNASIFVGKTDNSDALTSVLNENDFYALFIGTPRANEEHRLSILDEAVKYNPEVIVLFPGLDDTVDMGLYRLNRLGYEGRIEVANSLDEIIALIAEFSHEDALFIGGNGQEAIIEIQERIRLLSENL